MWLCFEPIIIAGKRIKHAPTWSKILFWHNGFWNARYSDRINLMVQNWDVYNIAMRISRDIHKACYSRSLSWSWRNGGKVRPKYQGVFVGSWEYHKNRPRIWRKFPRFSPISWRWKSDSQCHFLHNSWNASASLRQYKEFKRNREIYIKHVGRLCNFKF